MFSNIAYHAIMARWHFPHLMENDLNAYGKYACILFEFVLIFLDIFLSIGLFVFDLIITEFGVWLLFANHLSNKHS